MQFIVIDVAPQELAGLKQVLGLDEIAAEVAVIRQGVDMANTQIDDLLAVQAEMKAASDRVEAALDKVVKALDDMGLSPEQREKVDQAISTARSETQELNAAAQRGEDAVSDDTPEEPPVEGSSRKGIKKTSH